MKLGGPPSNNIKTVLASRAAFVWSQQTNRCCPVKQEENNVLNGEDAVINGENMSCRNITKHKQMSLSCISLDPLVKCTDGATP